MRRGLVGENFLGFVPPFFFLLSTFCLSCLIFGNETETSQGEGRLRRAEPRKVTASRSYCIADPDWVGFSVF